MAVENSQIQLGASMYVPATYSSERLVEIANGMKFPDLRSVIFCTEDAVRPDELYQAMQNLTHALPSFERGKGPLRYIRVRNPDVMARCICCSGIEHIDGFVLPKVTAQNFGNYLANLSDSDRFGLMPTLETREVFSAADMIELRELMLNDSRVQARIVCLRIGGNDLLSLLRVRRPFGKTIYDTAVGSVISRLAGEFIPYGFGLTAPVCELLGAEFDLTLKRELELDLQHGLFGKTAIHPSQIATIEQSYKATHEDYSEALQIVRPDAPAVFRSGRRMCEPATHMAWAKMVLARAEIYGVLEPVDDALRASH